MARFSINVERLRVYSLTAPLTVIAPLVRAAKARTDRLGIPEAALSPFSPLEKAMDNPGLDHDGVSRWINENDFLGDGKTIPVDKVGLTALINLAALSALTDPAKDMDAAAVAAKVAAAEEAEAAEAEPEDVFVGTDGDSDAGSDADSDPEEEETAETAETGETPDETATDAETGEGGDDGEAEGGDDAEGDTSEDTAAE